MPLLRPAVLAFALLLSACGAAPSEPPASTPATPAAYDGKLKIGDLVRGIVEVHDEHTLAVKQRISRERSAVEFVTFTRAPEFVPPPGGVIVVFRVVGSSTHHTPPDAGGSWDWIEEFQCELITVELSEREAIDAARACAQQLDDASEYDLQRPFAFSSGYHEPGNWVVRYHDQPPKMRIPNGIEIEINAARRCRIRSLR